uniref:Major facilitator superfamily (MFS) profile domain-containing protein n=1 Tax=Globodera rostochiensis TaxID=31243 RepID=A0A914HNA5_GLORO
MNIGHIPSADGTTRNRARQLARSPPPEAEQFRWSNPRCEATDDRRMGSRRATRPPKLGRTDEVLAALERGCEKLRKYESIPNGNKLDKWRKDDERSKLLLDGAELNKTYSPPPNRRPVTNQFGIGCDGTSARPLSDWCSVYVSAFLTFCSAIQFSIFYASMWPYLQKLDVNATENLFGYIIAIYSFGNILGFVFIGAMATRIKKIRSLLYSCFLLMFVGNGLYLAVDLAPANKVKYILCIARFVAGIGSCNFTLLKAYVSLINSEKDRPKAIALVACAAALGLSAGPVFQALFVPLGYPGLKVFFLPKLSISMYTAPALLASLLNIGNLFCVRMFMGEKRVELCDTAAKTNDQQQQQHLKQLPDYDRIALFLCYLTRFTQMFVYTTLETIGSALAMLMFSWHRSQAVLYTSVAQSLMFLVDFLIYIIYIVFRVDKKLNFRLTLIISMVCLSAFYVLTFSYPFLPGHVMTFSGKALQNYTGEAIGCDRDRFDWCSSVRALHPWHFYAIYVIAVGLAFSNINMALNTLFPAILGAREHGVQEGLLQMVGLLARMVGPLVISSLYTKYGPREVWLVGLEAIGATLAMCWTTNSGVDANLRKSQRSQ